MFKMGATGRGSLLDFLNSWILLGGAFYAFGTILWIIALSKVKLTVAYPFTALTFVLVYVLSVLLLKEPVTTTSIMGVGLVLAGLFCLVLGK